MKKGLNKKRMMAAVLSVTMMTSSGGFLANGAEEKIGDISGHWAEDVITQAVDAGWLPLAEQNYFLPDAYIQRQEFAHLINQALRLTEKSILYFSDIDGVTYYDDIGKALRGGYMTGDAEGTFRPGETLSREEAAAIIGRLLPSEETATKQKTFADFDTVADWAKPHLLAASRKGYIAGNPEGNFVPAAAITKAEAVQIISRLVGGETIERGNLTVSKDNMTFSNVIISGNVYVAAGVSTVAFKDCKVLGNIYLDGANTTVNFSGTARVMEAKGNLTLNVDKSSQLEYLYLWGGNNTVFLDKETTIDTVVAYGKTEVKGEGAIGLLRANADGVKSIISPKEITIGEMTKEMPVINHKAYVASTSPKISPDGDKIIAYSKMIPTVKEVPYADGVTYHTDVYPKSHPFSSMYCSTGGVNLEENKYVEKEFFMSGKANVYHLYDNDTPYITEEDKAYTTRLLVRYPDATKGKAFSGRVYIDILNASSAIDLEDLWRRSYQHIMDKGDIYIGITSQSDVADALKRFDGQRYEALNWKVNDKNEDGLFFDMMSQLGTLLREQPQTLLPQAMKPKQVYLCGQSWSGDYVNTYSSVFYDYYNKGRSLFDGYVSIVSPAETFIASGVAGPRDVYQETKEPYMVIMSEGEHYFGSYGDWYLDFEYVRIPDANTPDYKFRFYELAGAGHSNPVSPIIPNNPEIGQANKGTIRAPKVYNGAEKPSDVQMDAFITASLENIHAWATTGVAAPSGEDNWLEYRTVVDPFVGAMPEPIRDENTNALGGIRMPQIDVPIGAYKPFRNDASTTDGSMTYFTKEKIKVLYPNGYASYKQQIASAAKKLLDKRYILQEDYDKIVAFDGNKVLFD